ASRGAGESEQPTEPCARDLYPWAGSFPSGHSHATTSKVGAELEDHGNSLLDCVGDVGRNDRGMPDEPTPSAPGLAVLSPTNAGFLNHRHLNNRGRPKTCTSANRQAFLPKDVMPPDQPATLSELLERRKLILSRSVVVLHELEHVNREIARVLRQR